MIIEDPIISILNIFIIIYDMMKNDEFLFLIYIFIGLYILI